MTRQVIIGSVKIGGENPVTVQTMYDIPLCNLEQNFTQRMSDLKRMGCDIIRFSYPQIQEHDFLCKVVDSCPMPVVADIHFDYRNALDAIECNVAKIRINPGNIGAKWKTQEIVKKALDKGVAIRIGLNSGSLPENKNQKDTAKLMCDTALEYITWFENLGFYNTVVSLKASDSEITYNACKMFSEMSDYPQHLGVTEAGPVITSCVRTTWTLARLLSQGIGSTIRYSITGSLESEVKAGTELLKTLNLRKNNVKIVSCPMCGRKTFNSQTFISEIENQLLLCNKDITVAVMGCQVNGPGEAKNADVAITGIGKRVFLYKKGTIYKEIALQDAKQELFELINSI